MGRELFHNIYCHMFPSQSLHQNTESLIVICTCGDGKENIQFDERWKDQEQEIKQQTENADISIELESVDRERRVQ